MINHLLEVQQDLLGEQQAMGNGLPNMDQLQCPLEWGLVSFISHMFIYIERERRELAKYILDIFTKQNANPFNTHSLTRYFQTILQYLHHPT